MRFLIVDDDLASREFLSSQLSGRGEGGSASNGTQAIEMFRQALDEGSPYGLVVLDSKLADMDGTAVLHALRSVEDQHGVASGEAAKVVTLGLPWLSGHGDAETESQNEVFLNRLQPVDPQLLEKAIESLTTDSEQPSTSSTTDGELRFLIVDDDRLCRVLMQDILSIYGDCDMVVNGEEAVRAVRLALEEGRPYDAVTLDIMMPEMDGHEALEKLRDVEAEHGVVGSAATNVIMSTALDDSKHCIRAFREGCEAYVTKPIQESELLSRMRGLDVPLPELV